MGAKTRSQVSSERQKWDKIFEGLVNLLKTQQRQLETLAKERKILGDRIKMLYERWVSDVRLYEDYISQMESDLETKEMARVLEAAKADMMVGLMNQEAYLYKLKLKETEDELTDFRIWFDLLSKYSKVITMKESSAPNVPDVLKDNGKLQNQKPEKQLTWRGLRMPSEDSKLVKKEEPEDDEVDMKRLEFDAGEP